MADFLPAYEAMIKNEGGYVMHTVPGDRGGQTYAGIARNAWPDWVGWKAIDRGQEVPASLVRDFYRQNFWNPLRADEMRHQAVAQAIFDFHVNAGGAARKLAQIVAGVTPDGVFGPRTLQALDEYDPELFVARYALAKIARYRDIVTRDRSQAKFLLGWLNRTLEGLT